MEPLCLLCSSLGVSVHVLTFLLTASDAPSCPPHHTAPLHITPRLEPEILLRAKQDFMKIDSVTDLEWVSAASVCLISAVTFFFFLFLICPHVLWLRLCLLRYLTFYCVSWLYAAHVGVSVCTAYIYMYVYIPCVEMNFIAPCWLLEINVGVSISLWIPTNWPKTSLYHFILVSMVIGEMQPIPLVAGWGHCIQDSSAVHHRDRNFPLTFTAVVNWELTTTHWSVVF